jgi:hypothetical protein
MEGIKWVSYKGKDILTIDFGYAKSDQDVMTMLSEVDNIILGRPKGTVLYLNNMEKGHVSPGSMRYYKESGNKIKDHVRGWAIFGISPVKKMILDLLVKAGIVTTISFNTEEEAKNWLVNL